ncbi:hypothetical protein ELI_0063 [Eubacterium callanderi]|uniref:Uncharacterized protein n=1 Tax=Eubacterium callanderi TaxID=53442 RepID=E3GHD0_9FIRM|nr:hypothetical protein ELI_0063 [Eubacterium callanderi]
MIFSKCNSYAKNIPKKPGFITLKHRNFIFLLSFSFIFVQNIDTVIKNNKPKNQYF